jgi:DNA-binding XRE family transcriptional regulator
MFQCKLAQAANINHESVNHIERSEEPRTVYELTAFKLTDDLGADVSTIRVDDGKRS